MANRYYENLYSDMSNELGLDENVNNESNKRKSPIYTEQLKFEDPQSIVNREVDPIQYGMSAQEIAETGAAVYKTADTAYKFFEGKDASLYSDIADKIQSIKFYEEADTLQSIYGENYVEGVGPTGGETTIGEATAKPGTGLALKIGGEALKYFADDDDPTTMNVGETVGTAASGAGTGVMLASMLSAPVLPVAVAAAVFSLLRGKKRRDKARELQKQKEAQDAIVQNYRDTLAEYRENRDQFLSNYEYEQQTEGLVDKYMS
jgi:hypothetical protein